MIYGYVNNDGFVVFTTNNQPKQNIDGLKCVELPSELGNPPSKYDVFDYLQYKWIDPRTDQEKYNDQSDSIKYQRDVLLYESDWTQIPNNSLTPEKQEEWAVYRQQLRDITNQPGYPFDVVWPVKPE